MTTLQELIDEIRQRINIEHATQFTDPELARYTNASFAGLVGLINSVNQDWHVENLEFTVSGSDDGYVLPESFNKLLLVSKQLSGNNFKTLFPLSNIDENLYNYGGITSLYILQRETQPTGQPRWKLTFKPNGSAAGTYKVKYYPKSRVYELEDEIDYDSNLQYWTEYVVLDVCIKCRIKDELDYNSLLQLKMQMKERIKKEATPVNVGMAQPIPQVNTPWYDNIMGGGNSGGWFNGNGGFY